MKMWKKLAACVLAAAMALTLLTACGGGGGSASGGSVDRSFASASFAQSVNDKLAAKGSNLKLKHDNALKAKAEIIAKGMSMSASEVSGMSQSELTNVITKKLQKALLDADLDYTKEDMGYAYGPSDDVMADKLADAFATNTAEKADKAGFAKCKIGEQNFVFMVYSYTR